MGYSAIPQHGGGGGGGASSLQDAYDGGRTIALSGLSTPVAITTTAVGEDGLTVTDGANTSRVRGSQVLAPDGTAGAPAVAVGPGDIGIYLRSTNVLGIATAGTNRLRIQGTTLRPESDGVMSLGIDGARWTNVFVGAGSLAAPSVSVGAVDMGLAYDAARGFQLVHAGVEMVRMIAGGVVVEAANLAVQGGSVAAPSISREGDSNTGVWWPSADVLGLSAGSEAVYVDNDDVVPTLRADAHATWDLGEPSLRWRVVWGQRGYFAAGTLSSCAVSVNEGDAGIYNPAPDQLGLVGGGQAVIVDADGAIPSLRPEADLTWYLGEASMRWAITFSSRVITQAGTPTASAIGVNAVNTGLYSPAVGQLGLLAGGEAVIVDNDSGTPSLHGDVSDTWDLGEALLRWRRAYVGAGTAAIPSINVGPGGGEGLYRPAAGLLGLVAEGQEIVRCIRLGSGIGQLRAISSGSASAPPFAFQPDLDAGMFLNTVGEVALTAAGTPIILDCAGATPSLRPNSDNTMVLGEAGLRYANVYAVTTTIGDLNMVGQHDDAHWTLVENRAGIYALDRRTGRAYRLAMEEVDPTEAPEPVS